MPLASYIVVTADCSPGAPATTCSWQLQYVLPSGTHTYSALIFDIRNATNNICNCTRTPGLPHIRVCLSLANLGNITEGLIISHRGCTAIAQDFRISPRVPTRHIFGGRQDSDAATWLDGYSLKLDGTLDQLRCCEKETGTGLELLQSAAHWSQERELPASKLLVVERIDQTGRSNLQTTN